MAKESESKGVSLKSVKKVESGGRLDSRLAHIGEVETAGRPPRSSEYLILEQPFRLLRS